MHLPHAFERKEGLPRWEAWMFEPGSAPRASGPILERCPVAASLTGRTAFSFLWKAEFPAPCARFVPVRGTAVEPRLTGRSRRTNAASPRGRLRSRDPQRRHVARLQWLFGNRRTVPTPRPRYEATPDRAIGRALVPAESSLHR